MLGNPPMPAFSMDIGEETPEVENYEVNTVTSEILIIFFLYSVYSI